MIYILGGGPAGLALAHGLALESDLRFSVIERQPAPGGLAQTVPWEPHGYHDLGPHKIFTLNQELMARVEALLSPTAWLTRPKISSIYMRGHYLPYPPSPFSLIGVYGPLAFSQMVLDYGQTRLRSLLNGSNPATFEEDIQGRLGSRLYEALFKPIALKLWGDPTNLDVKLSQGRVQTPSLVEVMGRLLGLKNSSEFEALEFRYPQGGLQKLWDAILAQTQPLGSYLLNHQITGLQTRNNRVDSILCKERTTGQEQEIALHDDDFVFSTLPLAKLAELLGQAISPTIIDRIKDVIQLNDLLLVFLKIDKPSLIDESWIFVPDPDIAFHRLSEQESFDPGMTPDGSILCCEIMDNENRPMGQLSNQELINLAHQGLMDMGFKDFSVLDQRVIRLPASYPVFRPGFEPVLHSILAEFDQFSNFRTIGRQGAFNYIGTLDAMDIGYGAARWLINSRQKELPSSWQKERERTSHYPVLD
jgi:protoporphyrinogen oxidase